MTLPENIPYNPSLKGIGFFLALTTATFAAGALSLFRPRLAFFTSAVFLSFASLLFLRRFVWRRHLTLTHDFLTVPSGFLRLRPTGLASVHITRAWAARVFVTAVICVRTGARAVAGRAASRSRAICGRDHPRGLRLVCAGRIQTALALC